MIVDAYHIFPWVTTNLGQVSAWQWVPLEAGSVSFPLAWAVITAG
jgi:hypothetical protein